MTGAPGGMNLATGLRRFRSPERLHTTLCCPWSSPRQRQQCSVSGHSRPQRELTVSATFRSSRRQSDRDADGRSQGSADEARRMCVARWFPERQLNRAVAIRHRRPIECRLPTAPDSRTRPISGIGGLELVAPKRPVGSVPGPPKEAPQQWAHTGRRHKGRLRRQVQGLQAAASRSGAQS